MESLKQAQKSNPKGRWWLKADACDVREGLRESMCGVWAGDEDLGDGMLQNLFKEYKARISRVKSMNDGNVNELLESVKGDLDWLLNGERGAKASYENALQAKRSAQNTLMELAWDTIGYEQLIKDCKCLTEELSSLISHPESTTSIAGFQSLKKRLLQYLQGLYSKKRSAASHLMVFMISDELRNSKPYAVPVQFLSYKSITDGKVRELEKELENVMTSIGMTVVGLYYIF